MIEPLQWTAWIVVLPLLAALLTFLFRSRGPALGLASALGVVAGVSVLVARVAAEGPLRHPVGGWGAPLGIELYVDGLSAVMLAMTAVVGVLTSISAAVCSAPRRAAAGEADPRSFWVLWPLLWAALNALFVSADLFNLYVTLELVGLSAVGLAALGADAGALTAAMRYLLVSLGGSLCYLMGVALLYAATGVLDLAVLGQSTVPGATTHAALAFIAIGMMLKTALFPVHFWLPPAHAAAPAAVSAVLSGLVVKASFYLLLRLWFDVFPELTSALAAHLLGVLGASAILWGSLQALRQARLKLLVAYSTVAQVGYLFLVFPLAQGSAALAAWGGVVYFALAHACAKAAMFVAAGAVTRSCGHDRLEDLAGLGGRLRLPMFAIGLAGVSLMGLPPSGGFVAKWTLLTAALADGRWWWAVVIVVGSLLAAAYVLRVVACAFHRGGEPDSAPARTMRSRTQEWVALALSLTAVALGLVGARVFPVLQAGAALLPEAGR